MINIENDKSYFACMSCLMGVLAGLVTKLASEELH